MRNGPVMLFVSPRAKPVKVREVFFFDTERVGNCLWWFDGENEMHEAMEPRRCRAILEAAWVQGLCGVDADYRLVGQP